jgi:hypothetical protein
MLEKGAKSPLLEPNLQALSQEVAFKDWVIVSCCTVASSHKLTFIAKLGSLQNGTQSLTAPVLPLLAITCPAADGALSAPYSPFPSSASSHHIPTCRPFPVGVECKAKLLKH